MEFLSTDVGATRAPRSVGGLLFPEGEPPLPTAVPVNGERMDVAYVVGVLMGNRDVARRRATAAEEAPMG